MKQKAVSKKVYYINPRKQSQRREYNKTINQFI